MQLACRLATVFVRTKPFHAHRHKTNVEATNKPASHPETLSYC
jgi:hypothetical protein